MESMVGNFDGDARATVSAVYDLAEVAALLGRPYSTVWQWNREGRIPVASFRLGNSHLFRKSEIDAWLGIGEPDRGQ